LDVERSCASTANFEKIGLTGPCRFDGLKLESGAPFFSATNLVAAAHISDRNVDSTGDFSDHNVDRMAAAMAADRIRNSRVRAASFRRRELASLLRRR